MKLQVPPASPLDITLDIADKLLKLIAVALGGVWTYWNYRKSRIYAQKLELSLSGSVFLKFGLCVEVALSIKNLGSAQHRVQQRGSSCVVTAVFEDLSEKLLVAFPVFSLHEHIEPGETITDRLAFRLPTDPAKLIWLKLNLRVASGRIEWNEGCLVRIVAHDLDKTEWQGD